MYLAMNRFTVPADCAAEFEEMWLTRESNLHELPGFIEFHMLKGPEEDGAILYASHTVWENEDRFRDWTRSQQFRDSHARAGSRPTKKLFTGHPRFEGFSAIQHITNPSE